MSQLQYIVSNIRWVKSGRAHVSTTCYYLGSARMLKSHQTKGHSGIRLLTVINSLEIQRNSAKEKKIKEAELGLDLISNYWTIPFWHGKFLSDCNVQPTKNTPFKHYFLFFVV